MKYISMPGDSLEFNLPEEIIKEVDAVLEEWQNNKVPEKVWSLDPAVWKDKKKDDVELSNRLGWLNLPGAMKNEAENLQEFAEEIKKEFEEIVLLGMGGSSLAPEVFFETFSNKKGYPRLSVLDSTHPLSVKKIIENYNLEKTLFIVASKSGTTTETLSFYYTFFNALSDSSSEPGKNFIAITDPGTSLEKLAGEKNFRKIFSTPDEVGGRYSVLTFFGLVPAALIGVDISQLLERAEEIEKLSGKNVPVKENPGFVLGAVLGKLSLAGKDKLTIIASPKISSFPVWIEQLVAESTGKEGKGILPVVGEALGAPEVYNDDRVFAYLRLKNDSNSETDALVKKLAENNFPVISIDLKDRYDLGKEFYRWEIATAMAGAVLNINPFDQPNVQLAKSLAKEYMDKFKETGNLSQENPVLQENNISVFGDTNASEMKYVLSNFLSDTQEGNYVAVMSFISPSEKIDNELNTLRITIRNNYKLPVTVGYGPRFLHSTGQLHKGDANKGYFIQITSSVKDDLEVPAKGYSFGTLISAQAEGDMKALQNSGRKVIRIHFEDDVEEGVANLSRMIKK